MEVSEIYALLSKSFSSIKISTREKISFIEIKASLLCEIVSFIKTHQQLDFNYLETIIGLDTEKEIELIYRFGSLSQKQFLNLKFSSPYESKIPSLTKEYVAAHYYELELAEMLGIEFEGHPGLHHFLLPENWVGHPLRKNYIYPESFEGITHRRVPLRKEHFRP